MGESGRGRSAGGQRGDHRVWRALERSGGGSPKPIPSASAREPFREAIQLSLSQGCNAMAIWQDLVADSGFSKHARACSRTSKQERNQMHTMKADVLERQCPGGVEQNPQRARSGPRAHWTDEPDFVVLGENGEALRVK